MAGQRIAHEVAVVTDVGDEAIALLVHQRLIRAAALQIVVADQAHAVLFRLRPLRRGGRLRIQCDGHRRETGGQEPKQYMSHGSSLRVEWNALHYNTLRRLSGHPTSAWPVATNSLPAA